MSIAEMSEQEIIEAPVTGMRGRTPRDEIEMPKTDREKEVGLIVDASGSNAEQAGPDSPMTRPWRTTGRWRRRTSTSRTSR